MAVTQQRFTAEHRREQIIDVATKLFARQGFNGTTTRQIAQQARVNEAIIFRHFPSKEDLYWAILEKKSNVGAKRDSFPELLNGPGTVREKFTALAEAVLRWRSEDPNLTRLLLFSALENHRLSQRFFRTYAADFYETVAEFIRQQIEAGTFRKVDPLLAARSFLGMVSYHSLIQDLFGWNKVQSFDPHTTCETMVSIWFDGMLPAGSQSRPVNSSANGSSKKSNGDRNHRKTR